MTTTNELSTSPQSHIDRIKAGIWDIHEGVSNGMAQPAPDEDNIMKGTLPRFKYVNQLGQRFVMQAGFERILARYLSHPFIGKVVTDRQFHAPKAADDLRFFGRDAAQEPTLPATQKMLGFFEHTEARDPRLLLAIHYVIEGSNNGAMFIAQAVKKAYGLEGTDGTLHLQPYGKAIREEWAAFRSAFNSLEISDELMTEMIAVGRETFHHMNAISAEAFALPEVPQA